MGERTTPGALIAAPLLAASALGVVASIAMVSAARHADMLGRHGGKEEEAGEERRAAGG